MQDSPKMQAFGKDLWEYTKRPAGAVEFFSVSQLAFPAFLA